MANNKNTLPQTNLGFVVGEYDGLLPESDIKTLEQIKSDEGNVAAGLLGAELAIEALVQRQAAEDIAAAKMAVSRSRGLPEAISNSPNTSLMVSSREIQWLSDDKQVPLTTLKTSNGKTFLWGDITGLSNHTRKALPDQGTLKKIVPAMQRHVGVFIDERHSSALRKEEYIRSSFLAYKDDNLLNNEFRGLLLRTRMNDQEVFLLAAAYRHNEQAKTLAPLMTKPYTK